MIDALAPNDRYSRSCFVIMPYGVRQVGSRRINFDRIYEDIFKPAIRRLRLDGRGMVPWRSDEPQESRVLILEMIQGLLRSRLAIAEVSTDNRNVHWELGMRHNAVRSGTVLLRLKRRPIPFDIMPIMTHEYGDTPQHVAEASIVAIANVLRATLHKNEVDSPAFIIARQTASLIGAPEAPTLIGETIADAELAVLRGAPADAAALYSKLVSMAPELPLFSQRQGTLFLQSGRPDLAEQSFLKTLAIDPTNGDARRILADLHQGRTSYLVAPDPLDSLFVKNMVSTQGRFDPQLLAQNTPHGLDVNIFSDTGRRGPLHSTVSVVSAPADDVSSVVQVLSHHGFSSHIGAFEVPEVNRTVYTFDVKSPTRKHLQSTINGLTSDLRSVDGIANIGIAERWGRGTGGGGFEGGGSGGGGFGVR